MPKQDSNGGKRKLRKPIPFAETYGVSNVDACIAIAEIVARQVRKDRDAGLATRTGGENLLALARAACKSAPKSAPAHVREYFTFLDRFPRAEYPNVDRYFARCRSEIRRALNVGASGVNENGWTERAHRGEQAAARLRDARGKVLARPGDHLRASDVKPAAAPPAAAAPKGKGKPPAVKPASAGKPAARRPRRPGAGK